MTSSKRFEKPCTQKLFYLYKLMRLSNKEVDFVKNWTRSKDCGAESSRIGAECTGIRNNVECTDSLDIQFVHSLWEEQCLDLLLPAMEREMPRRENGL